VGLSEEAAKEEGHKVKVHRFSFRYNAMALIKDEPEGFAKVVSDAESGDLLGVHIFGHNAVDLISEAALAKWLDVSTWEMATSVRPHPSLSEVVGEAAQISAGVSVYW
jgi:dihydrolipoamide dehydrogenase